MSQSFLTRRNLLRGAGVTLALPLLESLGCSREEARPGLGQASQKATFPKRLLVIYTPNGNFDLPAQVDFSAASSFAGTYYEPLEPFKHKLLLLRGLDLKAHDQPPGEPHQSGMAWLTGRKLNQGAFVGGDGTLAGWASGISVDQRIAQELGATTPYKSLHLGVQSTAYGGTEVRTVMSYAGSDQPIANETSPYQLFDLVFKDLGSDPLGVQKTKARRQSVIDAAEKRFEALKTKASAADKQKLEQHLQAIRDVEMKLSHPGVQLGGSCQLPGLVNPPVDLNAPASFPFITQMFIDQLTMAFACDLTRVATLQFSASTNNRPYPWLTYDDGTGPKPIEGDEHVMGHQPDTDLVSWGKLRAIKRWYMEQIAGLLAKLDSIPEGEGTLLDNTLIVWGSEITRGNTHSHIDSPFFMFGSAGGYLKTGRDLSFGDRPHNDLLVSMMHAMGVNETTFGDDGFCTGALPELTG
jgi:hypothetical protein